MSVPVSQPSESETEAVCTSDGVSPCEGSDAECTSPEPSSCPPPLGWKSVLKVVGEESQAWEVDGKCGRVRGRTYGDGPPVYFLCGVGGSWDLFALTMYLMRDEYRCVVMELPGEQSSFSLNDFTADLFQSADAQGDDRFTLFATAYSTPAAFTAMHAQPRRIDRAVIHAGIATRRLSFMERRLIGIGKCLPMSLGKLPFFQRVQEHNHRTWFPPFDKSRWQFLIDNTSAVAVRTLCRRMAAFEKVDLSGFLPEVKQPVHLLATEGEGVALTLQRERLQQLLPNSTTESLPHCGLLPYLTHPHLLSKSLKRLLAPTTEG